MRLDFDKILGTYSGKTGFVCGLGPSLKKHMDSFSELSKDKEKHAIICCNEFDEVWDIEPDFWVLANTKVVIEKFYQNFNRKKTTSVVYADSVDLTSREMVSSLLSVDYIPYDQRHFNNSDCVHKTGCCGHRIEGRRTIQEMLQDFTGFSERYGAGDTVALHMLSLAVMLGLNPIYVAGVELDYRKGYVNSAFQASDSFEHCIDRVMNDFRIIEQSAKNIGVRMVNLSPDSKLSSIFETLDLDFSRSV